MNKKIKFLLIIVLVLGILVIGLIGSFLYLAKDEPPPRDDDLWLSRLEIPEENAFYPVNQAVEKIYWPKEKTEIELIDNMIKGKEWNSEFAQKLLKENEETFNYFNEAVSLSRFQDPEYIDPEKVHFATPIRNLSDYRKIAKLNSVKFLYLLKQEKDEEAFDEAIMIIKFGQMIEESQGALIHYLMGMAIKEIGLENLRMMVKDTLLSPEVLKNYIVELNKYKVSKEGLKNTLKMEYITLANELSTLTPLGIAILSTGDIFLEETPEIPLGLRVAIKYPYFYKPNKTKRIIAESYRELINNVDKNCGEISEIKRLASSPLSSIKVLLTENILGKMLHDIVIVSLDGIHFRKCEEDFSVIGTQLLFALRTYQIEKGEFPSFLNELTPEYLSEVLKDPFDGKPVRYSSDKKIIYSVGKDLINTGGSEGEDWRLMPDPTFKIE